MKHDRSANQTNLNFLIEGGLIVSKHKVMQSDNGETLMKIQTILWFKI